MPARGGRRGWVYGQTPPKHFSPDPDPADQALCATCGAAHDIPDSLRCEYCRKAQDWADWLAEATNGEHVAVPWQIVWLSRWLRHSEQTGDTPRA